MTEVAAPADLRPPPLGWPWDQLADALLRWEAASRRAHAAAVANDLNAQRRAELDREEAHAAFVSLKQELAHQWLAGFRAALQYEPTAVAELLGALPPADTVTETLDALEDRIDAAEDAVVKLEYRRRA